MGKVLTFTAFVILFAGSLGAQAVSFSLGSQPIPEGLARSLDGATAVPGSRIPAAVDLSPLFPPPGYQGEQNSCVGWAVAYAAKTYQENLERGWGTGSPDKIFSPAFIYNQINGGRDAGSSLVRAVDLVKNLGAATLKTMPYDEGNFTAQPDQAALAEASRYTALAYEVVDPKNTAALKEVLAGKNPVIFGMKISENFLTYKGGVYSTPSGANLGGHAMVAVGYDDGKRAFLIQNSWSDRWGEKGLAWVDYQVFAQQVHTAVVLRDQVEAKPSVILPPVGVQASQGTFDDRIEVRWEPAPGAEGYQVFRSESARGTYTLTAEVQGTLYQDKSAAQGKFYFYTVKSSGPAGLSSHSSLTQGFLQSPAGLGVPSGLQAQVTGTRVRLLWTAVDGAENYRIYRFEESAGKYALVGESKQTGFEDRSLEQKTASHWYVVTALAGSKESPASESVTVTVTAQTLKKLRIPRDAQATQGQFPDRVEITWAGVNGAQAYEVIKFNSGSNRWEVLGTTQNLKFADTNPGRGPQFYGVTAVAGDVRSLTVDYISGYTSGVPSRPKKKYADEGYFGRNNREADFEDQKFFSSSRFFTDSKTYFDNFVPKDFFMTDTEKFFRVNPDFFKVDEKFFKTDENFFR